MTILVIVAALGTNGDRPAVVREDPEDEARAIGSQIRCPVCQGMPITDSPSEMARDMMKQVRKLHAEGKSEAEIYAYFTKAYGDWVLLRPKASGINWLVWLLPPIVLLGALMVVGRYLRAVHRRAPPTGPSIIDGEDAYLRAIRDEVQR